MEKEGLFKPAYLYYIREFAKVFVLYYFTLSIVLRGPTTMAPVLFAAFLHAVGN